MPVNTYSEAAAFREWLKARPNLSEGTARLYASAVNVALRTLGLEATEAALADHLARMPAARRGTARSAWRLFVEYRQGAGQPVTPIAPAGTVKRGRPKTPASRADLLVLALSEVMPPKAIATALWRGALPGSGRVEWKAGGTVYVLSKPLVLALREEFYQITSPGPDSPLVPEVADALAPAERLKLDRMIARARDAIRLGTAQPWAPPSAADETIRRG